MKKILLTLMAAVAMMSATAQRYLLVNDTMQVSPIPVEQIESITYEAYPQFYDKLLPGSMAHDPKLSLFSEALRLTALADTMQSYWYRDYYMGDRDAYYYVSDMWREMARYNSYRERRFTVFAETDSVMAANGIHNIADLMAYASRVYDELYPEDAAIDDPTDRRNALNRFVAYHILPEGLSYYYLTFFDGDQSVGLKLCVDRNRTDIAAWYATLMPHASLKCSYPDAGENTAMYLNRRGLKDGPDKYGSFVRGTKILGDAKQGFDHQTSNGYYYYIDQMLTYDKTTREEVLGGELWRVDFKTLSPDIMNSAPDLRGNYLVDDNTTSADSKEKNGRNILFDWNSMENITSNMEDGTTARFVHRRAHSNFWSWQGDEVNIMGRFDITIKLPPLPEGEWEVRMGFCALPINDYLNVWLNDELTVEQLDMCSPYNADSDGSMKGPRDCAHFNPSSGEQFWFSDVDHSSGRLQRRVLGRIVTDGKTDNYLRLQTTRIVGGSKLDYFELVPKCVYDNTEIPEE